MENSNAEIVLLYGSQTGTAKYVAERLHYTLLSNKYTVSLLSIDSFDVTQLPSINYVIFIVSTIGYGQCPYSMNNFWDFIMRDDLPSILNDLNYTIFGLGDSSYEKFNYCARALDKRFTQLGANRFYHIGLGDEQHDFGYEGEYEYWSNDLVSTLNKDHFPFHSHIDIEYQCKYECKSEKSNSDAVNINNIYEYFKGTVDSIENLTSKDAIKQVVRIKVNMDKNIAYSPGDILLIYPENSKQNIDFFMNYYSSTYNPIDIISFYSQSNTLLLKCAFQDLFKKYLNLTSIPKRQFCLLASRYTKDITHKEKLLSFGGSSTEGKSAFYYYCHKEKRTFIDFLIDFPSVKLPLNILIQEIGIIQPRELSISSLYSNNCPNQIELTLGLVDYLTEFKRHKQGLQSKYFIDSLSNIPFPIRINYRKGSFPVIPLKRNVLLIATGTGIAPIRSYLLHRNQQSKQCNKEELGSTMLLYGCRSESKDYLYKDELNNTSLSNLNLKIYNAFSRDQQHKEYVQNIIVNKADIFIPFIMSDCFIIIVGNSKFLPKAIRMAMIKGLVKELKINEDEAMKIYKEKINDKLHIESW